MTAVARIAVLHLRTVAPYRTQGLLVFGLLMLILARDPDAVVPALVVLPAPLIAVQPFVVADKADLGTLYAVLPVPAARCCSATTPGPWKASSPPRWPAWQRRRSSRGPRACRSAAAT
jgi:hypothetical protein